MDFSEVLNIALPVVYVVAGMALIWLFIELVMTLRKTRKTVDSLQKQIEPALKSAQRITASLEPVVEKADSLVDRVALTVDAANLELMRVDQILENTADITKTVSSAVDTVDNIASAPMDLLTSVTERVRSLFSPRRASDESISLGQKKANQGELTASDKPADTDFSENSDKGC